MVRHVERKAISPAQPTHILSCQSPRHIGWPPIKINGCPMGHRSPLCEGKPVDSRESIFRLPGNHINISPDPLSQSGVHPFGFVFFRLER
jgi:hypothetical protein